MAFSSAHTKIFFLHLHRLRRLTHNQRLHNTFCNPLRPRKQSLPTPHTPILPIYPHRAAPRRPPTHRTRHVRNCPAPMAETASTEALRRRDTDRQAHDSLARTKWDECVGLCAGSLCGVPHLDYAHTTAIRAWRLVTD